MWDPRPLPLHVEPAEDEPFSSYMLRLASDHGVSLKELWNAMGLDSALRQADVYLSPEDVTRVGVATGLISERVRAMTLASYADRGVFLPKTDRGDESVQIRAGLDADGVSTRRSRACGRCLLNRHDAWRLSWRWPYGFACQEHGVVLAGACPGCGQALAVLPRYGWPAPRSESTDLGEEPDAQTSGVVSVCCGFDLALLPHRPLEPDGRLAAAGATVARALSGQAMAIGGVPLSPPAWLADLRALFTAVCVAAPPELLEPLPAWAREAFIVHAVEVRIQAKPYHHEAGRFPELVAAVVPWVTEALAAPDLETLVDKLVTFGRVARQTRFPPTWYAVMSKFARMAGASETLRFALREAADQLRAG